ncbi:MAG: amidohydrolase family protein [Polyangiales bacterium]
MRFPRFTFLGCLLVASCAGDPPPQPQVATAKPPAPTTSASASAATPPPAAPIKRRLAIVMSSRPSGFSETTIHPDGTREEVLEIVQNGRGPKVKTHVAIAADGTVSKYEATGTNEMGTVVEEHFVLEGKHAKWSGKEENGSADLTSVAHYVPRSQSVDAMGVLADALEKNGGKLSLLPGGEARLEKVGEATAKGKNGDVHLWAWAITGLDLTPMRLWRRDDGSFFGITEPWFSAVPEGFEGAIDALVESQRVFERKRQLDDAKKLAHKPAGVLAITHARVLDVEKKAYLADKTVVVKDGKIVAITDKAPKDAEVIDAGGKALLPGFWDMHSHLGTSDGELDIASGVTSARDLGNDPDDLDDFKARIDKGDAIGPHVLRAGFIEGRGENAAGSKITAETEAEALAAVEFFAKRGYDQIKIYNSMKKELVPILAKAAHAKKMRVSGHVPVFMRAEDCVKAGYDEIQHVNMLFLNFFVDDKTDTRTPLRFSLVAEKAADFDFAGKPFKDFQKLLLTHKTVIDPTLNAFENLFVDRQGVMPPSALPIESRLPPQVRRYFLGGGLPVPDGKDQHYKDSFAATQKMVKVLHDSGVPVVVGTDSLAGLMYHRELELHVGAGIPAGEVIRYATLGSAKVMGKDKTTGSIAVGKDADLVLIDGDPLAKISDVRRVVKVLRSGVVYDSGEVYEAVGVKRL